MVKIHLYTEKEGTETGERWGGQRVGVLEAIFLGMGWLSD